MKSQFLNMAVLSLVLLFNPQMYAQSDGNYRSIQSGNWNSLSTWEVYGSGVWALASQVPDHSNSTEIRVRTGHTVTITATATADQVVVEVSAELVINDSKTLTVMDGTGEDMTINGTLQCHGHLAGNGLTGQVVINGTLNWDGGSVTVPNVTISNGAQVNISGASDKSFRYSAMSVSGTVTWTGTGRITGGAGANMSIGVIGVLDIQNDAAFQYDNGGGILSITNAGLVKKSGGTGTTSLSSAYLHNTGTVELQSGTLSHAGSGTHSGTFSIAAACSLIIASGSSTTGDGTLYQGEGYLFLSGGSLSCTGNTTGTIVSNQTKFLLTGGEVNGAGKLTVQGEMNWGGNTYINVTSLTLSGTAALTISGTQNKSFRFGRIYNHGTVTWTGTGNFMGGAGAIFDNLSDGTFDIQNDANFSYDGGGGTLTFNNAGLLKKSAGDGNSSFISAQINNTGSVLVQSGALYLSSGGTHTGTFSISASKTLYFSGGTHTLNEGSAINGAGTLAITSGTVNCGATIAGAPVSAQTAVVYTAGALEGTGNLIIHGTMDWSASSQVSITTLTIAAGASLTFSGANNKSLRLGGGIKNYGTIHWTGTGNIATGTSTITNEVGGVFNIANDASIYYDGGGGSSLVFTNKGTLRKHTATGSTSISISSFNNTDGIISVESGILNLNSSLSNYSSNTLQGGTYSIAGTLRVNGANITTNSAHITLNGASSQFLNNSNGADALASLATISASSSLLLRNGRNFSTDAATFTCNGTLDCAENVVSGAGNFVLASGGKLCIGSPDGITSTGASGNVQNAGSTRSFHQNATYEYTGTAPQSTGNGLPVTVANLTTNCIGPLTLSGQVNVTGTLTMYSGIINTDGLTLSLGQATPGVLSYTSGRIIGKFVRIFAASTVSDVLFPLGDNTRYAPATLSFTTALTASGDIMGEYLGIAPGTNGLPVNDGGNSVTAVGQEGFWRITPGEIGTGTFTIDLQATGFGGINDYTKLRILKRSDASSPWTVEGTHIQATGTNAIPVLHRSGLSLFSEFAVGSTSENPLPVELISFTAAPTGKSVELTWATATETGNYGFEIERARYPGTDNIPNWVKIGFVQGYGNSNSVKEYRFTDRTPLPEKALYRLKQLDNDGGFSFAAQAEVEWTSLPETFDLLQNYPNPFNPATSISFQLPQDAHVQITIYASNGERVAVLVDEMKGAGTHTVWFSPIHQGSGVYFCRMVSGDFTKTIKMIAMH